MSYGFSIFLIAVGAILRFAVTASASGINLQTVGTILMIVGLVGLVVSLAWMMRRRRTDVIYHDRGVTRVDAGPDGYPI